MASDYRRPNDHLVEPLFSGIDGAHEESHVVHTRARGLLIVLFTLIGIAVALALT